MKTASQKVMESIFKSETPLKELAKKATRAMRIPQYFPGGTRIFTPTIQGTIWGEPQQLTMSLLKTDLYDRRFVARRPRNIEEVVKGAFSEANKNSNGISSDESITTWPGVLDERGGRRDDGAWSQQYPFPCIKPAGQIIIRAEDLKGDNRPDGKQSLHNGLVNVSTCAKNGSSLNLQYLISMKRNIVAIDAQYRNFTQNLSFKLYRNQDQGHRKYMDEAGDFIPVNKRKAVFMPADPMRPIEYYDLEADAGMNRPFEPPKSGRDGMFFWISQRFPAEATFPEGFEYVMMGLVSDPNASLYRSRLQKGLGTAPRIPVAPSGKLMIDKDIADIYCMSVQQAQEAFSFFFTNMEASYELVRNAPGVAATAVLSMPKAGSGSIRIYIAVVTVNETKDIYSEAKRQLIEAEKMGFEGLAEENREWYDDLYERREQGRITIASEGDEKRRLDRVFLDDAFTSWGMQDGGYCDPDPRKFEACEMYANYDEDIQPWHSLPCYNEACSVPWMVRNRHEPLLYYCRLIEVWHSAFKQKARDQYGLPGMIMPHGYLPPAKPHPWYIENQAFDMCLEVVGQVMKVLWVQWDYRADEEMLKSLIYPALRDLALFYEAYCRRNYDGKYYNIMPVIESEAWGISYRLKYATNTTSAITVFRMILHLAIEAAQLLGTDDELIPGWREVAENLPSYPKFTISGIEILGSNPGVVPKSDYCYTADYTATLSDEINLDSAQEDKDLLTRSMDFVRTGWGKLGYILVGEYKDQIPYDLDNPSVLIGSNEMLASELTDGYFYGKGDIRVERLLNSRSRRIYLFPALPDWAEVAFRGFLARGGFEVSAAKSKDGVEAALIKARRSIPCKVMNPWPGKKITVTDTMAEKTVRHELNADNGECIIFPAEAGHEYSIDPA